MIKTFLIFLLSLLSLTSFAQKEDRLNTFIKKEGYTRLTDTGSWPKIVRPEFDFIKNYFLANNLVLNDYYIPRNHIFITRSQYRITVRHIKGLIILAELEYKNKHREQQEGILGNISGKDGQFIIDINTNNIKFFPEE
ncbi:MAG TPA: hypothetical protein VIM89_06995 [Mucilaginibacter sp.]